MAIPIELSQAINALRTREGSTIAEWLLKDPRVRKWAREAGVVLPKGHRQAIPRNPQRWLDLTPKDWSKGNRHIATLLGVSRQAVANKRRKLL